MFKIYHILTKAYISGIHDIKLWMNSGKLIALKFYLLTSNLVLYSVSVVPILFTSYLIHLKKVLSVHITLVCYQLLWLLLSAHI